MNRTNIYVFILSFIIGVAIFSIHNFGLAILYVTFIFSLVFGGVFTKTNSRVVFIVSIVLFSSSLGGLRFYVEDISKENIVLDVYVESEVLLEGVIVKEADQRERVQRLTIEIDSLSGDRIDRPTKVITSVDRFPNFNYGDRVQIKGKLEKPENFINENGREFDYVNYLRKDNINYTTAFPEITFISSGHGNKVKSILFKVKQSWINSVEQLIPDPHVSLLGGLVVGAKQSLGKELEDDFRRTGIIHIVVLSGYNVTIVAEAIMRFFSFLPALAGIILGAVAIIFFAIMTGASATIVRASIMALLVLLARATGRTNEITHALFLAGFFMVLHNPMIVLFDPSFQLSFIATLGLIYLAPQLEKYFRLVPSKFQLREFATATIATQIFVLPLLLFMMGEVSIVALPVNLLILSAIPLTMLFGFLAGVLGFISFVLAFPFTALSYFLLSYELLVVDIFARLPFASISVASFPIWLMIIIYIIYAFLLVRLHKR